MMGSGSLRPRTLLGIFDSAIEIAVSSPALAALSFLGALPVTLLGVFVCYAASEGVPVPGGLALLVFTCGLATLWCLIPAGAASSLVLARLSGRELGAGEAMREALKKSPFLLAAGSLTLAYWAISLPFLMVPLFFSGGAFLASPMVVEGAGPPWKLVGLGRRLLGRRGAAPAGLSLLWVVAILLLAANLATLLGVLLMLAKSLANIDTGYLASLLSPANPVFLPALVGVSFVILEPVRLASLALLYVDAKTRKEGADLHAAMESLHLPKSRSSMGQKTALLLLLMAAMAPRGVAAVTPKGAEHSSSEEVVLRRDIAALEEKATRIGTRSSEAVGRLSRQVEEEIDRGRHESARRRLDAASEELARVSPGDGKREVDTRRLAREVLARREFQRVDRRTGESVEFPEISFWDRLTRFLDRLFAKRDRDAPAPFRAFDTEGLTSLMWGLGLVAFMVLVVILVTRTLSSRRTAAGEEEVETSPETPGEATDKGPLGVDPLSRTPSAWLAEADRLAAMGAHRSALRAAYLALLSQLHRVRAIDYLPTRTNWDHARSFRGPEAQGRVFTDLTRRFDRAWYGQRSVGAEEYRAVRIRALSLLEEGPDSPAQGGALA